MRYLECEFAKGGKRYTYATEDETIAIGDKVKVPDWHGDGWQAVTVVAELDQPPKFQCKSILGKIAKEPEGDQ